MLEKILNNFKEISRIPRCSFYEEKILDFFKNWAKSKNFNYKTDKSGNIVIYVPASRGRENDETIILQNHMDMVCVKDTDSNHNFKCDEIEIIKENGWIKANKTTLGADNGIGIAIAMYLSEIKNHPPLEILITSSEEVGLIGALNLDASMLSGKKLINIDTEDLGEICVSSAGGMRIDIQKNIGKIGHTNRIAPTNIFKLFIGGMKGGHSGIEIDKNRGNIVFSFLEFLYNYKDNFEILEIKGGVADNAIPKEIEIIILTENEENFRKNLDIFIENIKNNFDAPNIFYKLTTEKFSPFEKIIEKEKFKKLIKPILETKIGVIKMSKKIENLVETSNNLGLFYLGENKIKLTYAPRSSHKNQLQKIKNNISKSFEGFKINFSEEYPGWEGNPNSKFIKDIENAYKKYNKKTEILAYHAGLECGALVEKLGGNIEAVSIGPTIKNAHTTSEMCELNSVEIIVKILEEYLQKN